MSSIIEELKENLANSTQGKWQTQDKIWQFGWDGAVSFLNEKNNAQIIANCNMHFNPQNDAKLICSMQNSLPLLINLFNASKEYASISNLEEDDIKFINARNNFISAIDALNKETESKNTPGATNGEVNPLYTPPTNTGDNSI